MEVLKGDSEYISHNFDFRNFKGKTILITGANGFLGQNFVNCLLSNINNFKQLILVDISFPVGTSSKKVKVLRIGNVYAKIPKFKGVNYIIHLASIASPKKYNKVPFSVIDVNVNGLINILKQYKDDESLESFLHFSTSEVYGEPEVIPTPETYYGNVNTMNPRSCYAESKRLGEQICYQFHRIYGMPIKIVRPFNNYGPFMSITDGRLPSQLARAMETYSPLMIECPDSTRAFCYVADALIGYFKALLWGQFDVFNIGNPDEVRIKTFAEIFEEKAKVYGNEMIIEYSSPRVGWIPKRRCPDITKARLHLGYEPKVPLDVGIERYIKSLLQAK